MLTASTCGVRQTFHNALLADRVCAIATSGFHARLMLAHQGYAPDNDKGIGGFGVALCFRFVD